MFVRVTGPLRFIVLANEGWWVANAYVSGMKEDLNVVGNEYQTFTTMWTM